LQVYGGGTGDEELLLHIMNAARAPLWLLSKPWLHQGLPRDVSDRAELQAVKPHALLFLIRCQVW
jgi:hypothetical protein